MAGLVSGANLAGADARLGDEADAIGTSYEHRASISAGIQPPETHGHNTIYLDDSIEFEDYRHWADRSREVEKLIRTDNVGLAQIGNLLIGRKIKNSAPVIDTSSGKVSPNKEGDGGSGDEKPRTGDPVTDTYGIDESEWETAQRASRTATWGSIFYLITTDILGPTNVPWAISQFGLGPGVALYTVFGIMAFYSGLQLWKMFVGLDSTRYPLRNYGDLAFRIFGKWTRIGVNALQSFQFFLNVALIIESNGQGLAQMATGANGTGYLCFVLAEVIFMLLGFVLGQIRTLQRLAWLCNIAIWLNVVVLLTTMYAVHHYPPNYAASLQSYNTPQGPVNVTANWPPGLTLYNRINGIMNCVFAYGGATLFNELMAEMRRPFDFWKGFLCAEIFIYLCYLIFGLVVYTAQGQFSFNPAYQGIPGSAYAFQTVGNAISFISGLIACLLYGNIGIKVFYAAVLRDIFQFPPLDTKKGKYTWVALIPIYYALAFIVAAAIPQISNLTGFVGALCIMQFSYTFPPLFIVGYRVQRDAVLPEETYDSTTGKAQRVDGGMSRWIRGFRKNLALNLFDCLYSLAALATAGLGLWATGTGMHEAFAAGNLTPFTCANPAG